MKNSKKTFLITAIRTYYSTSEFEVEAKNEEEAKEIAYKMLDNDEVYFDGIDVCDDPDEIEICEI